MKKLTNTIILPALIFITACSWGLSGKKVVGNRNITTKKVTTKDYDVIELIGSLDVHLEKGTEGNITVTTDDNLHEYVEITVIDDRLVITKKRNIYLKPTKGIHVTVPFDHISKVSLTGSGGIDTKDLIHANKFTASTRGSGDIVLGVVSSEIMIYQKGSGDIVLDVVSSEIRTYKQGSGDITLSGSTNNSDVSIQGSGDFKGFELNSKHTKVSVFGSGKARVFAKESLLAKVWGSGDIVYKGNPSNMDGNVFGSGDITHRNHNSR